MNLSENSLNRTELIWSKWSILHQKSNISLLPVDNSFTGWGSTIEEFSKHVETHRKPNQDNNPKNIVDDILNQDLIPNNLLTCVGKTLKYKFICLFTHKTYYKINN